MLILYTQPYVKHHEVSIFNPIKIKHTAYFSVEAFIDEANKMAGHIWYECFDSKVS